MLYMSMHQQTIHTIKPTNTPMLKFYFSTTFVITPTHFNLDHPHGPTEHN